MNSLPSRKEFIEFAEGASIEREPQAQILHLLASSALVRENLSELKRDLYKIDVLIPDFQPDPGFRLEVAKVIPFLMRKSQRQIPFSKKELFLLVTGCLLMAGAIGYLLRNF